MSDLHSTGGTPAPSPAAAPSGDVQASVFEALRGALGAPTPPHEPRRDAAAEAARQYQLAAAEARRNEEARERQVQQLAAAEALRLSRATRAQQEAVWALVRAAASAGAVGLVLGTLIGFFSAARGGAQ